MVREDRVVSMGKFSEFILNVCLLNEFFDPSTGHATCAEDDSDCLLKQYIGSNQSFVVDVVICDYVTSLLGQSIVCPG